MVSLFQTKEQSRLFDATLAEFARIGYRGGLVEKGYSYRDRLEAGSPSRKIDAVLFGRTPADYETALIGIVRTNGDSGRSLVNQHRALCAPLILEVDQEQVSLWSVSADEDATAKLESLDLTGVQNWIRQFAEELKPREFLRTKNLNRRDVVFYKSTLFAGLIPEVEDRIADDLDPLLVAAFKAGWNTFRKTAGQNPPEDRLFKVAFWLLTGKVFADRKHSDFARFGSAPDPDDVLHQVADHYEEKFARLLNRETREAIFARVWPKMDFRHLSVDVLSQIWSRTLVSKETRKRLGIHKTRSSIVRYMVERIPFETFAPEERLVLEPCSGSASFLIGAMDRLRNLPAHGSSPQSRHEYYQRMLRGIEKDAFGYEISRLCLSLADYPNPNNWNIFPDDVFSGSSLATLLADTRIVLCNPPFEKFQPSQKRVYKAQHWYPPAELLGRVLDGLHPEGVIGFVMPRAFLDGQDFRAVREKLVRRFKEIEITKLPDRGWDKAGPETALLIATKPSSSDFAHVTQHIVREQEFREFDWYHTVGSTDSCDKTSADASESLLIPQLQEVWDHLQYSTRLGSIAEAHKGIEWTESIEGNEQLLVKERPQEGYVLGVPPRVTFNSFERPSTKYLCFLEKYRRGKAFDRPWDKPKVIINKTRRSRFGWRVTAYADFDKLACFETYIAIWPRDEALNVPLAAVLNGPLANAFMAIHTGTSFTVKTLHSLPFPDFTERDIASLNNLVDQYKAAVTPKLFEPSQPIALPPSNVKADELLRKIDAIVLDAYGLPPRLERMLLDFDLFKYTPRLVPFHFKEYFPADFKPYFKLSEWLTGKPAKATVGAFKAIKRDLPEHILSAFTDNSNEGDCQ